MTLEENLRKRVLMLAEKNKRLDGRKLEEIRKLEIIYGISNKAEGSCLVKLGNTEVMVGIKLELGEPYPDMPESGNLVVTGEVTALAGEEHEPGRPGPDVITMARVVDRGVRESHCIDLDKLVIKKGERVWVVFIDAYITNDDGNLIDASAIGALAALKKSEIPVYDKKTDAIDHESKKKKSKLPLSDEPVAVTIARVGDYLLADPTKDEIQVSDALLTITYNKKNNLVSLQKDKVEGLTVKEIEKALKIAKKVSKDIRSKIK